MKPGNLNEEARRVIAAGRAGNPAPELVRARIRRSVATKLLGGGMALSLASHAFPLLAAGGVKLGIALTLAGTVGAGAWYGLSESAFGTAASAIQAPNAQQGRRIAAALEHRAPGSAKERLDTSRLAANNTTAQQQAEPRIANAVSEASNNTPLNTESKVSSRQAARDRSQQPADAASGLTEEVGLLSDASAKLNQGDAQGAARLLRQYDQQFKAKVLIQERVATGVLVQCALGNVDSARRAAKRFHKSWPRSPLARRIAGSCAGDTVKR